MGRSLSPAKPELTYLREALAVGRPGGWARWLTPAAIAAVFAPLTGWAWACGWFVLTRIYIDLVARPSEHGPVGEAEGAWARRALAILSVKWAILAAIGLVAMLRGGVWGFVGGGLYLLGLLLPATSSAKRSRLAYFAAAAPIATGLLAMGPFALRLGGGVSGAVLVTTAAALCLIHTYRQALATRAMIAEIEAAKAAAEASTAAKSEFISLVSHELRTPLTGVTAAASEIAASASDSTSKRAAGLIGDAARMMRVLLNDLLDAAKLEAGRMEVEATPFGLRTLILDTTLFWRTELRQRGLYLRLAGARRLPAWVAGDPTRIRQVLNNLLSNAAKFTVEGGVTLDLAVEPTEDRLALTITVRDTGPGMSPEQIARLFAPYEQLGAATNRTHGGTGLGLHISRELARRMGGDITVEATPGVGACFRVTISVAAAYAPEPIELFDQALMADGLRVLVVDDHEVNRQAFSMILQAWATRLATAQDGAEALEILATESFDLVLMDMHMPRLDGREATRRLRAQAGPNRTVPVIALTGAASAEDIEGYLQAGMDACVMKPVSAPELLSAIASVLNGPREDEVLLAG